jgi:hypothetical protein
MLRLGIWEDMGIVLMTRYKVDAHTGTPSAPRAEAGSSIARDLRTGALTCRGDSTRWRAMLFGTVAAGALCITASRTATAGPDACVVGPGNLVTCSGNQSTGIDAGPDFTPVPGTTLVINNLTRDIVGSAGMEFEGIRWAVAANNSPINIISNTGSFAINVSSFGMNLHSGAGKSVTLNHIGDIFAGRGGISACPTELIQRAVLCRSA